MPFLNLTRKRNPSSNTNLSHISRGTAQPGVLYPVSFVDIVPGDSLSVQPSVFVQSLPLLAPLMGSFDICLEMFFAPDRLYQKKLFNNEVGATLNPSEVRFPRLDFTNGNNGNGFGASVDMNSVSRWSSLAGLDGADNWVRITPSLADLVSKHYVVEPNSLAEFIGLPVGFSPSVYQSQSTLGSISALRVCSYIDIVRNYYTNTQESTIPTGSLSFDGAVYSRAHEELSTLDSIIASVRDSNADILSNIPFDELFQSHRWLFCRTLAPYRLDTWLNTSNYNSGPGQTQVSVVRNDDGDDVVLVNDMRSGSRILRFLELAMSGGSRYDDYLEAQFDVRAPKDITTPVFLGSMRTSLGFERVLQTSESSPQSPQGNLTGQGAAGEKFRKRRFSFNEYGTFVVMFSLRPRVDYFQGIDPMLLKPNLMSKYVSALDRLGMQPLEIAQLCAVPVPNSIANDTIDGDVYLNKYAETKTGAEVNPINRSVGYHPAWSEYMSVSNRLHGKLVGDMRYWALARYYETPSQTTVNALPDYFDGLDSWVVNVFGVAPAQTTLVGDGLNVSTYIDPSHYNYAFADTSPYAENFVWQVALDIRGRREKSKVNLPNFV